MPHWVWVNDMAFFAFPDGKAFLVDGDSGKMLGMLSTGYSFTSVLIPKTGAVIYAPEIYFSRGTRGTRTDVVTIYDATRLEPVGEIEIPPKRASLMPMPGAQALTDDDRFLLIYNFTPSQSVTVVDTHSRKFVGEIEKKLRGPVGYTSAQPAVSISPTNFRECVSTTVTDCDGVKL